jgi:hypothetical protein
MDRLHPLGQNWWPREGTIHFCLVGVGGMLSWPSLSGDGETQLQYGENNITYDYLGDTGSVWKWLTKSSVLACPVGRRYWPLLQTSSWWDHFGETACTEWPILAGKDWAQTLRADSPREGQHPCHTAQHTNFKKGERHWESPCQNCQHLDSKSRKESRTFSELIFVFFL